MKKRFIATSLILATALAASPVLLIGCGGDKYSSVKFPAQDTGYAVTSQGGSVVAYGNYLYYINGSRGYDDANGNANIWGSVVKGGLYRAELNGTRDDGDKLLFNPSSDSEGIEFKYQKGKDYFDNEINVVDTTAIAPKTVGTSGYASGGIFIYDNNVYFASPNNERDKKGTVQTTRTDFFMMPLSGGKPTKIYTTTEKIDTSQSAYAFYKYGNSVYLTVNESGTIISVKINPAKAKVEDPVKFEVKATSVYFPVRDTYYTGISPNTPEDFIYFVRAVTEDDDLERSGTAIEAMRPDGTQNFKLSVSGATETIEAVRDGIVFIRTTEAGSTYIKYTNLHNQLMEYSADYKDEQNSLPEDKKNSNISGKFATAITSTITSTYPFRLDKTSNDVFFVGVSSSAMTLYKSGNSPVSGTLCTSTGTPQFIKNNYLYYAGSSSDYYRVPLFSHIDGYGTAQKLAESTSTATFGCDYAAGYFSYFAQVDEWASGYTYFVKADGMEGAEPIFVGARAQADIPTEEQIKEAKGETEEKTE